MPTYATGQTMSSLEERLAQLDVRFAQLKAEVRQAQQLASLGTAAATIAHEVNNLLTPIKAYAQTALQLDDGELMKKALTVTLKNVQMLVSMSDRVLEISAAVPPERVSVSVRAAVEDGVASLCRDLEKDGIRFSLLVPPECCVLADPLQLQQVFFNLLLNAREVLSNTGTGRLTISAHEVGEHVSIEMKDNGPGIEPELLPQIFDPLQTSKPIQRDSRKRCSGLGLSLCRDLIEENGGSISAASDLGAGTTFTIVLPRPDPQ